MGAAASSFNEAQPIASDVMSGVVMICPFILGVFWGIELKLYYLCSG